MQGPILAFLWVVFAAVPAHANARTDYLIELLEESDAFRVRVQAALSLGQLSAEPRSLRALTKALRDRHPAVRVAVISSLEKLGSPTSLKALKRASKDKVAAVRRAAKRASHKIRLAEKRKARGERVQYYVAVTQPAAKRGLVREGLLVRAKAVLASRVSEIDGVELAPERQDHAAATTAVKSRNLVGYAVDMSVTKVENHPKGKRVAISMMLTTYPGREIRATLQGAAIATDGVWPALEGAIEGVLRKLPSAMRASIARSRP